MTEVTINTPIKLTEKQFQRAVTDMAGWLGWKSHHEVNSFGTKPGKPDLELTHPQYGIVFLELKVGKRVPTAPQTEWIDHYRSCGIPAYVVYPRDMEAIEAILHGNHVEIEEWWR